MTNERHGEITRYVEMSLTTVEGLGTHGARLDITEPCNAWVQLYHKPFQLYFQPTPCLSAWSGYRSSGAVWLMTNSTCPWCHLVPFFPTSWLGGLRWGWSVFVLYSVHGSFCVCCSSMWRSQNVSESPKDQRWPNIVKTSTAWDP